MTKKLKSSAGHCLAKYSLIGGGLWLLVVGGWWWSMGRPVAKRGELQRFEIQKGESAKNIAERLKTAGLIRSPLYFLWVVKKEALVLQAGSYQIGPAAPPWFIAETLTQGRAEEIRLTIPEGYRSEQIAETAGLPIEEFLIAAKGLEGQLFPDTYFVKEAVTARELVTILRNNFMKKAGVIEPDTLILASLVERETRASEEKAVVAGILKKRLAAGWPLELDATVQYFLGKPGNWWPKTTLLDRKLASPYNTYLHTGLPPAPIGNPGLTAIRAVQNPESSPYWFYLHDKTGTIHYAATVTEHNQNILTYIR